jgi:predicted cobalt transporter CbtA
VPAELAAAFAASALTASAAFWLILGPLYGWLFARFADLRQTRGAHA